MNSAAEKPISNSLSIIQTIITDDRSIELTARDLALLVLIHHEISQNEDVSLAISYSTLQALHNRIDTIETGGSQNPERRLIESISRLIKADAIVKADMNRLKMTVDTEYQVTTLGEAIADWHQVQSEFSGEPLTAIFKSFISQLILISGQATKASTDEEWQVHVLQQMQYTLKGMLVNIQRHQKELDRQHAAMREFVPTLLIQVSEESISQCEAQLVTVISTIDDLQEVVLASTSRAQNLIDEISALATPSNAKLVETICDEFQRRLINIAQWTTQRAIDWVEHHNVVHNYLRTVVRIDKNRRVTDSLKRAIASVPNWTLKLPAEPHFYRMRDDFEKTPNTKKVPRSPINSASRELVFEEVSSVENFEVTLHKYLIESLSGGEAYASSILTSSAIEAQDTSEIVPNFPWLIGAMVEAGIVDESVRNWTPVTHQIEIEELKITK